MRTFDLILPEPPEPAPGLRAEPPGSLRFENDDDLYVPKVLQREGLAGYEPNSMALLLALLARGSGGRFFDVGSNVGVFSFLTSALTDWSVTAFEPVPELAAVARELARRNGLEIEVEEIALGRSDGAATLYLSSVTDSSNSLREGFRPSSRSLQVPLRTLDRYVAETGRIPDLMKLDTETTEPDVLEGGRRTLDVHRPWILCEVLAGRTEADLNRILPRHGYCLYHVTGEWPPPPQNKVVGDREHQHNNWLFAPETPDRSLWEAAAGWRHALEACLPWGRRSGERRPADRPALAWADSDQTGVLAGRWRPRSVEPRCLPLVVGDGDLLVHCSLAAGSRFYLSHGDTPFDRPANDAAEWPVEPGVLYELEVDLERVEGDPAIQLWVIQYAGTERLGHVNLALRPGENLLAFRGEERADSMRVALRFSGAGVARLGGLRLFEFK